MEKARPGEEKGQVLFRNNSIKPTFCQQPGMGNPSGPYLKKRIRIPQAPQKWLYVTVHMLRDLKSGFLFIQ